QTIQTIRGVIPLAVSSRRSDPLVIALGHAVGKRFENPDVALTLHEIRTAPDTHQTLIELSLRTNQRGTSTGHGELDASPELSLQPDPQRHQPELLDALGQPVPWFPSGLDFATTHITLTVPNLPHNRPLKELRYYTVTRTTVNVPFEFHEIPM